MQAITPEQVVQQVDALLERRRTDQARSLLKPALASHPDHAGLLLQSAWVDYLDDRNDDALVAVKQVLLSEPKSESGRLLYFELLFAKASNVEAERVILELLRDYPEHAHYYGRYAELMLSTLNWSKARQLALEGLKYDPESAGCLTAQALCDFIEQPGSAANHGLQQLLVRHPQSARTLLLVVVALDRRGEGREALNVAQQLLRAQPDNDHIVNLVRQLRIASHWSMLPLWPVQRFGWGASVAIWLIGIVSINLLSRIDSRLSGAFAIVLLTYVAYSWIWPPLLKRMLRA